LKTEGQRIDAGSRELVRWHAGDEDFKQKYDKLEKQYTKIAKKVDERERERDGWSARLAETSRFLEALDREVPLVNFDEAAWMAVVAQVVVGVDGGMEFQLRDGTKITAEQPKLATTHSNTKAQAQ
jgi:hypothetical protein